MFLFSLEGMHWGLKHLLEWSGHLPDQIKVGGFIMRVSGNGWLRLQPVICCTLISFLILVVKGCQMPLAPTGSYSTGRERSLASRLLVYPELRKVVASGKHPS